MTRDDIIAALERSARIRETGEPTPSNADAALLRALADALREGVDDTYPIVNEHGLRAIGPVWIIPEPRLP